MNKSSQSFNEIIKDFLSKISPEGAKNFSVKKDNDSTSVLIHFELFKKSIKYFTIFMILIGVPIILSAPLDIITKIACLFIGPMTFFLQNRIYIKITKYSDGKIEVIKQGSFIKKIYIIQPNAHIHIVAQFRKWVGNRYFGGNDVYELVVVYTDEIFGEKRTSLVFDDRKFLFQGGRNNIKGVLKEEEIQEIAKELELPYSVNNS